jgi:integrase
MLSSGIIQNDYIQRTKDKRAFLCGPIFLTLQRPCKPITACTVSNILAKSLKIADLVGFHPQDFRPTGATAAVDTGFSGQSIIKVGRWRNAEVFREHYVHSKIPGDITDSI